MELVRELSVIVSEILTDKYRLEAEVQEVLATYELGVEFGCEGRGKGGETKRGRGLSLQEVLGELFVTCEY